jgi:glycosidase
MKRLLPLLLALVLTNLGWAADTPAWWQVPTGPVYQVLVYSYADSDGNGTGDLQGLIHRLDAIQALGTTALWLNPIHPASSYHGYDVTDYKAINPAFGTMDDFDALVKQAHARGIHIILDMVFNHTSIGHPWFKAHPDWYVTKKDGVTYGSASMGGWNRRSSDGAQYFGSFSGSMPDLDVTNPQVVAELQSILKFWMDRGVDGFRFDAAMWIFNAGKEPQGLSVTAETKKWWNALRAYARSIKPDVYFIGEVYTEQSQELAAYAGGFDGLFDFVQAKMVRDMSPSGSVVTPSGQVTSLAKALESNYKQYARTPGFMISPFLSNHDQDRAMSVALSKFDAPAAWGSGANLNDVDAITVAKTKAVTRYKDEAFLEYTLPGLPYVYYGEELGMVGQRYKNDDVARRDAFPWGDDDPAGDTTSWMKSSAALQPDENKGTTSWYDQSSDPDSILNWYKSLGALKKAHPALHTIDYAVCDWTGANGGNLVSYFRTGGGEKVLATVNFGWTPAAFTPPAGTRLTPELASGSAPAPAAGGSITLAAGQAVLWTVGQ